MAKQNNKQDSLKKYIKFSGLAFQMAITIFLAAKLGGYLDTKLNLEKNIFTAILALLAVIFSLYNIIRKLNAN